MYRILGSDGKEYGPVSSEPLGQWIREKRVDGDTRVQGEDGQWRPLREVPELVALLQAPVVVPSLISESGESRSVPSDFDGDYDLDIVACLSAAWNTLKQHTSLLFMSSSIYLGIMFLLGLLGALPELGIVFSLVSMVIAGPMLGGFYHVCLRVIRRENPPWHAVFDGIRKSFLHLFLGQSVYGIVMLVLLMPGIFMLIHSLSPRLIAVQKGQPFEWPELGSVLPGLALLGMVLPVVVFLQTAWMFLWPLIIDHRIGFWTAMGRSLRQVNRRWWSCFGLFLVLGILNVLGMMVCMVGVLFTFPITSLASMHAYETVIHGRKAE
jgi:hypothetical protein